MDRQRRWQGPREKRALGLILRQAERRGICEPPIELRALVASVPYSPDEIDHAFELLVSADGRTVGGTLELHHLAEDCLAQLGDAGLTVQADASADWSLTEKGQAMCLLLDAYADPKHRWRSKTQHSRRPEA